MTRLALLAAFVAALCLKPLYAADVKKTRKLEQPLPKAFETMNERQQKKALGVQEETKKSPFDMTSVMSKESSKDKDKARRRDLSKKPQDKAKAKAKDTSSGVREMVLEQAKRKLAKMQQENAGSKNFDATRRISSSIERRGIRTSKSMPAVTNAMPLALPGNKHIRNTKHENIAYSSNPQQSTTKAAKTTKDTKSSSRSFWNRLSKKTEEEGSLRELKNSKTSPLKNSKISFSDTLDSTFHKAVDLAASSVPKVNPEDTTSAAIHERQFGRKRATKHHQNRNLNENQTGGVLDICQEDAELEEELFAEFFGTECNCTETEDGLTVLSCTDTACTYCDDSGETCAIYSYGNIYNNDGSDSGVFDTLVYSSGRNDTVTLMVPGSGVDSCLVTVNEEDCSSCSLDDDVCFDDDSFGVNIDCSNVEEGAVVPSCGRVSTDGVLQVYNTDHGFSLGSCNRELDEAELICEENSVFYESLEDDLYFCSCIAYDGTFELNCYNKCTFCNTEGTVCGRDSVIAGTFLSTDNFTTTYVIQDFEYVVGRDEFLSYVEYNTDEFSEDLGTCEFYVNDSLCDSCVVQNCTDEFGAFTGTAPLIDCNVIEAGAVIDLCSNVQVEDGIFEFKSAGEFVECIDFSPANDNCLEAELIQGDGSTIFGSTELSLPDGVVFSCAGDSESPGLWYTVMGTGTGIKATTCVLNETMYYFDTQISVYSGECNDLVCETGNDDSEDSEECGFLSTVFWYGEPGTMYRIRVHGYSEDFGDFGLLVEETDISSEACSALSFQLMETSDDYRSSFTCECEGESGGNALSCSDECSYCNDENDVCAIKEEGAFIDDTGSATIHYELWTYVTGRDESVSFEWLNCSSYGEDCDACEISVNGERCDRCEFIDCVDEFGFYLVEGRIVQCNNIDGGASYNTCDATLDLDGVFEFENKNGFDLEFEAGNCTTFPPGTITPADTPEPIVAPADLADAATPTPAPEVDGPSDREASAGVSAPQRSLLWLLFVIGSLGNHLA